MLKSYEAVYQKGKLKWLVDKPPIVSARIIVTILEENTPVPKRRTPPPSLIGKAKILGDIIQPIVDEKEWECLN